MFTRRNLFLSLAAAPVAFATTTPKPVVISSWYDVESKIHTYTFTAKGRSYYSKCSMEYTRDLYEVHKIFMPKLLAFYVCQLTSPKTKVKIENQRNGLPPVQGNRIGMSIYKTVDKQRHNFVLSMKCNNEPNVVVKLPSIELY